MCMREGNILWISRISLLHRLFFVNAPLFWLKCAVQVRCRQNGLTIMVVVRYSVDDEIWLMVDVNLVLTATFVCHNDRWLHFYVVFFVIPDCQFIGIGFRTEQVLRTVKCPLKRLFSLFNCTSHNFKLRSYLWLYQKWFLAIWNSIFINCTTKCNFTLFFSSDQENKRNLHAQRFSSSEMDRIAF